METNVNYTLVGAFVIGLIVTMIVCIIWLSSGLESDDYTYYKVYMREAVSGLSKEAPVEFNGVNVGEVSSLQINSRNPQLVELLLKVQSSTPITRGTRAKLELRALSGSSFILLEDKGIDMRPLIIMPGQNYPVIPTTPSILVRLDTALTQINESFHQLSISIRSLLDKENLASFKETLINIKKLTGSLANESEHIQSILENTSKVTRSMSVETIPAANAAFINIGNAAGELSNVSQQIKQNPAVIMRGKATPAPGPGE